MLAGAAGSIIVKYVNSSYFWVCTSLSRIPLKGALVSYGGVTLVNGVLAMATALAPRLGYDQAAAIAKEAFASGRTVRQVATEWDVLPADELAHLADTIPYEILCGIGRRVQRKYAGGER